MENSEEEPDQSWLWIVCAAFGVVLLWEGAKTVLRPCLMRLGLHSVPNSLIPSTQPVSPSLPTPQVPIQVSVNVDSSRSSPVQHEERVQVSSEASRPAGAGPGGSEATERPILGSCLHPSGQPSNGDGINQRGLNSAPPPPPQPPLRVPNTLVAHFHKHRRDMAPGPKLWRH